LIARDFQRLLQFFLGPLAFAILSTSLLLV
jgi:hypothetical protein